MSSKLTHLANEHYDNLGNFGFILGYKQAFKDIEENLAKELQKLEVYPFMGERIMTLKIYKAKISSYLKDMEQEYE